MSIQPAVETIAAPSKAASAAVGSPPRKMSKAKCIATIITPLHL